MAIEKEQHKSSEIENIKCLNCGNPDAKRLLLKQYGTKSSTPIFLTNLDDAKKEFNDLEYPIWIVCFDCGKQSVIE